MCRNIFSLYLKGFANQCTYSRTIFEYDICFSHFTLLELYVKNCFVKLIKTLKINNICFIMNSICFEFLGCIWIYTFDD